MGLRARCWLLCCLAACGGGDGGGGEGGPDAGVTGANQPCRVDVQSSNGGFGSYDYFYDDQGRLIRIEGPDGEVTSFEYSGYLMVRRTSTLGYLIDYYYDSRDNLITEDYDEQPETFPGVDDRTSHTYDTNDLRIHTGIDVGVDLYLDGQAWYYYEGIRLVRKDVDAFGYGDVDHTITFTYRDDGLLGSQVAVYSGDRGTYYTYTYSYDDQQRLATLVADYITFVTTYTYVYEC